MTAITSPIDPALAMPVNDPRLQEAVLHYCLGLMDEADRRAFEADLLEDPDLSDMVWRMEEALSAMALAMKPVAPPKGTLGGIVARITPAAPVAVRRGTMMRDAVYFFGTLSVIAIAAAFALAFVAAG